MRIRTAALGCILLLTIAACDAVAPEPITLDAKEVTFRFAFDSGTLSGGPFDVPAREAATLTGRLDGFSREEILSARVVSVELERVLPPLMNLDALLQGVVVRLDGEGRSPVDIAETNTLPARFRADLTPIGADVGAYLRQPSFGASLRIMPQDLPDDQYEFLVRLRLSIDVEGI